MAGLFSRQKNWDDGDTLTEADLEAAFDHIYDNLVAGTTTAVGLVQLEDSHTSTSVVKAACPKNVKEAYDLAGTMVTKASFNANTMLAADSDNTPLPIVIGSSCLVGKKATGGITDLSKADVRTILNIEDGATKYPDTGEQAFLDADHTKLNGIEDEANITDAVNVGTSIHGVANKATPVDADKIPSIDTENANVLKTSTWTNIKAFLKTYFDTVYAVVLGADDNYVTDAEKTVIGNTSGANTGDQAITPEGTAVLSTGEGATKFLRADGDNSCSWQIPAGGGSLDNVVEDTTPELGGQLIAHEFDIKLDSLLSVDGKYSGITCDGVLGATLAFGDLVYLNTTDQRWELADADAEATAGNVDLRIVLAAGNNGDTRLLLERGYVRVDAWNFTSYGQALFVSCTAGDMTATAPSASGDIVRVVGYASTFADQIHFNPGKTWIEIA